MQIPSFRSSEKAMVEVTPFCWTGLVNIVNCMHVHRHVVHIYLSILDWTHIKTQFDTIIIIVPNVFCQSFQKSAKSVQN